MVLPHCILLISWQYIHPDTIVTYIFHKYLLTTETQKQSRNPELQDKSSRYLVLFHMPWLMRKRTRSMANWTLFVPFSQRVPLFVALVNHCPISFYTTPNIHIGSWDRAILWDSLTLSIGSASCKKLPKWQEPLDPTVITIMMSEQQCMPSLAHEMYNQHLQFTSPACCWFFNRTNQVLERNKSLESRVTTA